MKRIRYISLFLIIFLSACSATKHVPDGEFLLNKVKIKSEVPNIQKDEMLSYIRQHPNTKSFGLKFQLGLYNVSGKDTASGWNKFWKRFGEPPVIYNERLTEISVQQLEKFFINKGYLNADVEAHASEGKKKISVEYVISANKPYTVGKYRMAVENPVLQALTADTAASLIQSGMLFDSDVLNSELQRITDGMRNSGYYNFNKDYLILLADSNQQGKKIDVTLDVRRYLKRNPDTLNSFIFKRFRIEKIIFHTNQDANLLSENANAAMLDTLSKSGYYVVDDDKSFVSLDALMHNTYIQPHSYYSNIMAERTNTALNQLGAVKFVNITFSHTGDSALDCHIIIIPAKSFSASFDLEGTRIDKYWGAAVGLGFTNKNAFGGAETLGFKSRLAFERQTDIWAREISGQLSLKFPKFLLPAVSSDFRRKIHANTEFALNASFQNRPTEFDALNFGTGMTYSWNRSRYQHSFELFNLSYMQFDVTQEFDYTYLATGEYNSYNYDNRFIMRMGYSGAFSNYNSARPLKNFSTYRYSVELAGNLLYAANAIFGAKADSTGYHLFNVRFSQYARGEFNTSYYQIFDKNNRFVYHLGFGIAFPYGNAKIMPYERRFYAGGANSVRGWSESSLGPGAYQRMPNARSRDYNQVGDIKLDLSMEYRAKLFWLLESALFLDAGNIWTIRDYPEQKGGVFAFDKFYNQIAIAYGAGLRLDLSMFILRLDVGIRLFDPSITLRTEQWRTAPKLNQDFALHIAIGYPF